MEREEQLRREISEELAIEQRGRLAAEQHVRSMEYAVQVEKVE